MGRGSERAEEASASSESNSRRNLQGRYKYSSASENEDDDIHSSGKSKRQRTEPNQMLSDDMEPSISSSREMNNTARPPRNDNAHPVFHSRGRRPPTGGSYDRRRRNGNNAFYNHQAQQSKSQAGNAYEMDYCVPHPVFPGPFGFGQQMHFGFPGPYMGFSDPNFFGNRKNSLFTAPPPSMPFTDPRPALHGKGPTRSRQNDYAQYFVDTGARPQNFIRDPDMSVISDDYPQVKELMRLKDEQILKRSFNPIYLKCDLREMKLSRALFGTKFDAILIDPPMEEYVRRAPGVVDANAYWTWGEIRNLEIEAIADNPCFIFLWVGSSEGLEEGRLCLKKWGFKRIDDICWLKTNHESKSMSDLVNRDASSLFKRTKEHCLVGIKGCIAPNLNEHLMHPNIDVDIVISEEPPYGSTQKPDYIYSIIEHLVQGRRRIEIFGEDHNLRRGWLTVGNGLSSSNFNLESYIRNFANSEGKVWEGAPMRLVPMDAPHLTGTTSMIEDLRPKSPQRKRQGENRPPG